MQRYILNSGFGSFISVPKISFSNTKEKHCVAFNTTKNTTLRYRVSGKISAYLEMIIQFSKILFVPTAFKTGILILLGITSGLAQDTTWTKADKQNLVMEYKRTQKEVIEETQHLTKAQWNFKDKPGSWSIGQVLEHLYMWELITQRDTRGAIWNGINMEDVTKLLEDDSTATNWIYEDKPHTSPDYTIPTGFIPDQINLKLFSSKCDELINEIEQSDLNFRLYIRKIPNYNKNLVQLHMIHYGHVDRHLRQIRRIKSHPLFPK